MTYCMGWFSLDLRAGEKWTKWRNREGKWRKRWLRGRTADKIELVCVHRQALVQSLNTKSALNIYYLSTLSKLLHYTARRMVIYIICEIRNIKTVHKHIFLLSWRYKCKWLHFNVYFTRKGRLEKGHKHEKIDWGSNPKLPHRHSDGKYKKWNVSDIW